MRPYVITALRNPLLWLVPMILLPLLAAIGAVMTSGQTEVRATVWTQVSALIDTTGSDLKPPAEVETETFNERLNTESFRSDILTAAGLDDQVAKGEWPPESAVAGFLSKIPVLGAFAGFFGGTASSDATLNHDRALAEVKKSITAEARGNNLMYVTYVGSDGDTGVALVNGAIQTYQKENLGQSSAQAQAVLDFYANQVAERQQELEEADSNLRAFEAEHPSAVGAPRPASEAQELASLQSIYNIRLSQYELAMSRQGDAQVRAQASLTTEDNNFEVVDSPRAPLGSSLNLRQAAMLTFVGIVLGVGLGALLIALRTWLDQTVRKGEDVRKLLGLELLAIVPNLKKGGK
jgi:uncharacterized protein involved in exopolysaccharide biosynthesis